MLTSRENLANFLTFARAYDGHSSFNFKYTINIEFVFLCLILSVHNFTMFQKREEEEGGGGGDRQC